MLAIKWAREQSVPFLGICLGFQIAVVEWARNVCGLKGIVYIKLLWIWPSPNSRCLLRCPLYRTGRKDRSSRCHLHA